MLFRHRLLINLTKNMVVLVKQKKYIKFDYFKVRLNYTPSPSSTIECLKRQGCFVVPLLIMMLRYIRLRNLQGQIIAQLME